MILTPLALLAISRRGPSMQWRAENDLCPSPFRRSAFVRRGFAGLVRVGLWVGRMTEDGSGLRVWRCNRAEIPLREWSDSDALAF